MKQDLATAYRQMKSPNIKTRKRALKLIHRSHNLSVFERILVSC